MLSIARVIIIYIYIYIYIYIFHRLKPHADDPSKILRSKVLGFSLCPVLSELSVLSVPGCLAAWLPGSLLALWLPGSRGAWPRGGRKRSRGTLQILGRGSQVWPQGGWKRSRGRIRWIHAWEVVFLYSNATRIPPHQLGGLSRHLQVMHCDCFSYPKTS